MNFPGIKIVFEVRANFRLLLEVSRFDLYLSDVISALLKVLLIGVACSASLRVCAYLTDVRLLK